MGRPIPLRLWSGNPNRDGRVWEMALLTDLHSLASVFIREISSVSFSAHLPTVSRRQWGRQRIVLQGGRWRGCTTLPIFTQGPTPVCAWPRQPGRINTDGQARCIDRAGGLPSANIIIERQPPGQHLIPRRARPAGGHRLVSPGPCLSAPADSANPPVPVP